MQQFENLSEFKAVDELRKEVLTWIDYHRVTHKSLAATLKISEQNFCDWLKGRKNLTTETVGKLAYLTRDPLRFARPTGARITNVQMYGQPVPGGPIDAQDARAEFAAEYTEEILKTHRQRDENTL